MMSVSTYTPEGYKLINAMANAKDKGVCSICGSKHIRSEWLKRVPVDHPAPPYKIAGGNECFKGGTT